MLAGSRAILATTKATAEATVVEKTKETTLDATTKETTEVEVYDSEPQEAKQRAWQPAKEEKPKGTDEKKLAGAVEKALDEAQRLERQQEVFLKLQAKHALYCRCLSKNQWDFLRLLLSYVLVGTLVLLLVIPTETPSSASELTPDLLNVPKNAFQPLDFSKPSQYGYLSCSWTWMNGELDLLDLGWFSYMSYVSDEDAAFMLPRLFDETKWEIKYYLPSSFLCLHVLLFSLDVLFFVRQGEFVLCVRMYLIIV